MTPYERQHPQRVLHKPTPPPRLTSRLRAFGSTRAFTAFQRAQILGATVPASLNCQYPVPGCYFLRSDFFIRRRDAQGVLEGPDPDFMRWFRRFREQVSLLEDIVHGEIG
jgi:hypothetical protein